MIRLLLVALLVAGCAPPLSMLQRETGCRSASAERIGDGGWYVEGCGKTWSCYYYVIPAHECESAVPIVRLRCW